MKFFTVSFVKNYNILDVIFNQRYGEKLYITQYLGPGSSVGIATGYGLDGPGIESRWGARFSAPFQSGPGAHPASCTRGTGSFPGVKSGRAVMLTPHRLLVPWSRKGTAFASVVRQMPGLHSQRRGTARTLPN